MGALDTNWSFEVARVTMTAVWSQEAALRRHQVVERSQRRLALERQRKSMRQASDARFSAHLVHALGNGQRPAAVQGASVVGGEVARRVASRAEQGAAWWGELASDTGDRLRELGQQADRLTAHRTRVLDRLQDIERVRSETLRSLWV